jgi:hypothetical protein
MAEESATGAINEAETKILIFEEYGSQYHGMNIMTDACHGRRRNTAQSDAIALGNHTIGIGLLDWRLS